MSLRISAVFIFLSSTYFPASQEISQISDVTTYFRLSQIFRFQIFHYFSAYFSDLKILVCQLTYYRFHICQLKYTALFQIFRFHIRFSNFRFVDLFILTYYLLFAPVLNFSWLSLTVCTSSV